MTRIMQIRLVLFAIGIVVWGYGTAVDDATIRWVGIGFLLASLLLRFFSRGRRDGGQPPA
jgi:hypothetical protein